MSLRAIADRFLMPALRRALARLRASIFDTYAIKSYSVEGEDLIVHRIVRGKSPGFYVDVGAHHPRRFSNTHRFYRDGWRGINVEPNPAAMKAFRTARNRDINLQYGVASQPARLTYYQFDESALNTFDRSLAESRVADTPYRLTGTIEVPVERLDRLLEEHLPAGQEIDFLSVDVEGLDLQVLQSNDWQRYRPTCVLVESLDTAIEDDMRGEIFLYMRQQGYELLAKTFNTLIFRDRANEPADAG
jgi:FkbM family methyltransferase